MCVSRPSCNAALEVGDELLAQAPPAAPATLGRPESSSPSPRAPSWSALNVARIPAIPPARGEVAEEALHREALAGFRAIFAVPSLRLVVCLYSAQTLVAGALNVLLIVAAIELLDLGRSGPGLLNSAVGIGGIIGAAVALGLVGLRGLGTAFAFGLVLWGLPLILFGAWPETAAAIVFLGLLGVGNTLVDVSGLTLLQRTAPEEVLGRVFGVLESLVVGTLGLGAIIAPLLVYSSASAGRSSPPGSCCRRSRSSHGPGCARSTSGRSYRSASSSFSSAFRSLRRCHRPRSSISPGASCACRRRSARRSRARARSATASTSWTRGIWTC